MENMNQDADDLFDFFERAIEPIEQDAIFKLKAAFPDRSMVVTKHFSYPKLLEKCKEDYHQRFIQVIQSEWPVAIKRVNLIALIEQYRKSLNNAVDFTIRHGRHQIRLTPKTPLNYTIRSARFFFEASRSLTELFIQQLRYHREKQNSEFNSNKDADNDFTKTPVLPSGFLNVEERGKDDEPEQQSE